MIQKWPKLWVCRELSDWALNGCPIPPPQPVKVLWLDRLRQAAGSTAFVETGTLAGTTSGLMSYVEGLAVHTIEIDKRQFDRAQENLKGRSSVTQYLGNSAEVLPRLLDTLPHRTIFWLDAHCSGDHTGQAATKSVLTLEVEQLIAILDREPILVLDDARAFNGGHGYPILGELVDNLKSVSQDYDVIHQFYAVTFAPKSVFKHMEANPYSVSMAPFVSK